MDDDEFGDFAGSTSSSTNGESLLSLVQPEIKMLSKHWLAMLKDYALLSLPPGHKCPSFTLYFEHLMPVVFNFIPKTFVLTFKQIMQISFQ